MVLNLSILNWQIHLSRAVPGALPYPFSVCSVVSPVTSFIPEIGNLGLLSFSFVSLAKILINSVNIFKELAFSFTEFFSILLFS